MKYYLQFKGDPLYEVDGMVAGYIAMKDEFVKRWPRSFYGPNEAAIKGLAIVGKPELTDEEARELREGTGEGGMDHKYDMANALRKGFTHG